jgi:hypothetical protein
MNKLSFSQDYFVYEPKRQGVYPIQESDWNRLERMIEKIVPERKIYSILASAALGVFASSIFSVISLYTLKDLPTWIFPTNCAILISSLIVGIALIKIDSQQKEILQVSSKIILSDLHNIKEKFEQTEKSTETSLPSYGLPHNYEHSSWNPRDIPVNVPVTENTNMICQIKLNAIGQTFRIYFHLVTKSGKKVWIGFGNGENRSSKRKDEFTREIKYSMKEICFIENVAYAFKLGFSELDDTIDKIDAVRLRASDQDLSKVYFSFGFVNGE